MTQPCCLLDISVRARNSIVIFPKMFFLYVMMFLVYYFTYPFGFSRIAFMVLVAWIYHLCVLVYHRYELPAVLDGRINDNNARDSLWLNGTETAGARNVLVRHFVQILPLNNPIQPQPQPPNTPIDPNTVVAADNQDTVEQ
jgi:Ca2+/Na+ antiporter